MNVKKKINVQYFAHLREQRGVDEETILTAAKTPNEIYTELKKHYHFTLETDNLQVAINNQFSSWDEELADNDTLIFIPPVAGG